MEPRYEGDAVLHTADGEYGCTASLRVWTNMSGARTGPPGVDEGPSGWGGTLRLGSPVDAEAARLVWGPKAVLVGDRSGPVTVTGRNGAALTVKGSGAPPF
ncbi:hypothetical protein KNE206_42160 [Kitasatospora sp. NE20-6]|uniref:hypothetical protein n=1 Tax=Kitasatospora sp. NE20-6 TaxID=2859066 RepID=UPI0034DCBEF4